MSRSKPALIAAGVSIVLTVALEASVLIVPGEPFLLQPSVEGLFALVLAAVVYLAAHARAHVSGRALDPVPTEPPPE